MPVVPPVCDFGRPAPGFALPGTDGRTYTHRDIAGPRGMLVMFICNHCPYVARGARPDHPRCARPAGTGHRRGGDQRQRRRGLPAGQLRQHGDHGGGEGLSLPLSLRRGTGRRARLWRRLHAGFLRLRRRRRLAVSRPARCLAPAGRPRRPAPRSLRGDEAGRRDRHGPKEQIPSMGCSIKWKPA